MPVFASHMVAWLNGRALDLGSNGCRFESCRDRCFSPITIKGDRSGVRTRASEETRTWVWRLRPLGHPVGYQKVDTEGFEPSTSRMRNGRSSTELSAHTTT